ncbi:MAG TPA: GNAT family protein [Polyangiaceae bacterium]|jgi:RimJ/RimL family protein N-acetyltransferase|nr:GNAT family protein [Polyangiaceae bacterium]
MQFRSVPLRGDTIELTPYQSSDFEDVCAAALSAPEMFRFIPSRMATRADVEERLSAARVLAEKEMGTVFVTRRRDTGAVIGSTACLVTDRAHRRIEIGFTWLIPSAQRSRANTEAKVLQLGHCFDAAQAVRVEFKTDARNVRSRAALARIGATEEGTLRSHMICWDGHRRDSVYFSVIDAEWPSVRARLEGLLKTGGSVQR